ncbi:response regulator [Coraliomargarita sp. W4R72]
MPEITAPSMDNSIKILIVEDNANFTESLKELIDLSERMEFTASFRSAENCLDALQNKSPKADVVLLDLQLPGKNGMTLIPELRRLIPDAEIIVLTSNDDYKTTVEAIRLGVSGYILKNASIGQISEAIYEVNDGASIIDPKLSRLVLDALLTTAAGCHETLSEREREVLELMAVGYVKKEVAYRLGISYRTVAQYTESIYKKLQVPNVAAAVAAAIRKGLI